MSTSENETNKVNSILKALKQMPKIYRFISVISATIALCATILGLSSCGVTRAVVHNGATGTVTEIKITTQNPTTVTASPNVQVPIDASQNGKKNETP